MKKFVTVEERIDQLDKRLFDLTTAISNLITLVLTTHVVIPKGEKEKTEKCPE